jgi:lysophospholipase L1-like esterase
MPAPAQPEFSRGRSLLFATLLVVGFFALLEGGLRLVGLGPSVRPRILLRQMDSDITLPFIQKDAEVFWSPEPGYRGVFQGQPVSINSLGLRGAEVAPGRAAGGRRRLLALGDSITFGYGVGDEDSYAFQLGLRLAPSHIEVVNAGVTGFTSHQVLGYFRRLVPLLRPDAISVCIGWNDGNRRTADDREYARRLALARDVEGVLDELYLYRALKSVYLRAGLRGPRDPRPVPRVSLVQYRENLTFLVAEARGAGVRPVFLALPRRKDPAERASRDTPYAGVLAETAQALHVPLLGIGDLGIGTTRDSTVEYFIDSLHLSPAGAARLADTLAPQLLAPGVLGP